MPASIRVVRVARLALGVLLLVLLGGLVTLACVARCEAPEPAGLGSIALLANEDEPGTAMIVTGRVLRPDGTPLAGARLRAYQADDAGYYCRGPLGLNLGAARARLSAWLVTDGAGRFEARSIRPAGYPGGRDPAHVHVELHADGLPPQDQNPHQGNLWRFASARERYHSVRQGKLMTASVPADDRPVRPCAGRPVGLEPGRAVTLPPPCPGRRSSSICSAPPSWAGTA